MAKKTIQGRVADEVLQRTETVTLGGKEYEVAPPTVGTLIMVSEEIASLPQLRLDSENLVYDVLREAKNCKAVARAVAVMILGSRMAANGAKTSETERGGIFARLCARRREKAKETPVDALARELLYSASPEEMQSAVAQLIQRMQLGDFFGLTTFLNAINQTKPTREVEKKTTASGR